jgi:glycine cleavage system T protein (aminomethyltransferase)
MSLGTLRATPFHGRSAESNRRNAWASRGEFTLASDYGNAHGEALAARFGSVVSDISWQWRVRVSGARASEFISRFLTRNAAALPPGAALDALWLNDAGGVRGSGKVVRLGPDSFLLVSAKADCEWLAEAADLYGVAVRDVTNDEGVLALIGPTSRKVLAAAGLDTNIEPLALRPLFWRGLNVKLSRLSIGYEIWCEPDDALVVWDHLAEAGRRFALCPAGLAAMDILDLECGIARVGHDCTLATSEVSPDPSPQSLGLAGLVDRAHLFNGRSGFLAAGPDTLPAGIVLDSDMPAPLSTLTSNERPVGHTLDSAYSPAMRRVIALAVLTLDGPGPGSILAAGGVSCRVIALPFLPIPAPMTAPTESLPSIV